MTKIYAVLLCLSAMACNDCIEKNSVRDIISQNTIDKLVILDKIQKDLIIEAWKMRRRISDLGSPQFMFYHNQNHKIVKIDYCNGKIIEFEISGSMILYNSKFYRLDIDISSIDYPEN